MNIVAVLGLVIVACHAEPTNRPRTFPADFEFGVASAAYQIEGAWNTDGKGENIWDYMSHTNPSSIKNGTTADITANSYHNYKRDVQMMRELGLSTYRFSVAWSRILPTGFANEINLAGIEYYNNFIDEMLKYNITPMITMYHWDLPQKLQEMGGFVNPLIATWFEDYARIVFRNFGDRVKFWITFNEPKEICAYGYGEASNAPKINMAGIAPYICTKNVLIAHANVYHMYNEEFKPSQGGECGIAYSVNWYGPLTDTPEDEFAAEIVRQGEWALYADPVFSADGGFSKEFSERVAAKSAHQGYPRSRLPEFTEEEKVWVRGSADFFAVNHYTAYLISATDHKDPLRVPSLRDDEDAGLYQDPTWLPSASSWLTMAPNSLYNAMIGLQKRYNNTVFYITENGWSMTPDRGLIDDERITFFKAALENVLDSLDAGINIKGYMAWSFMDNFEWANGYTECFGLYHVDFKDPARTRTPRKSAFVYKNIVKNRYVDHNYEPESMTMTIDEGH